MGTDRAALAKIAAVYDIHGNLPALDAVLTEITEAQVDLVIVGGDVASGPMPKETVERLKTLGERALFIRGNSDREVVARYDSLARPELRVDGGAGEDEVERITTWTANQLSREQRDFLDSFSALTELDIQGLGSTLFCHGSPRSDDEIITSATREGRMTPILAHVTQDIVTCGHTHVQFDRTICGKRVINAGSVGRPYEGEPGAYWAMLGPDVVLRRTPYDFERAADQIRASGYPGAEEFVRENVLASPSAAETTAIFETMAAQRDAEI